MGNRNHGSLLKKATAAGLACLLLVAGLPLPAAAEESCKDWNTAKFFKSATVDEVRACLSAGRGPNEQDPKGLTALHRAARDTSDPAVIEALLDAGANPRSSSIAGRLPRYYARKNKKIKDSDAWQRLMIVSVKAPKKADWSQVQAVPHHRKTKIRLYEDIALQGNRKIKGRFQSATADSITLVLENGQARTFPKLAVRKVLTRRPIRKRWPGWVAIGVSIASLEIAIALFAESTPPVLLRLGSHAFHTLPTAAAFFYGSRMKGIYKVPPKNRMLLVADKQLGDQESASVKQEDPQD